jgi:hypothetical protein
MEPVAKVIVLPAPVDPLVTMKSLIVVLKLTTAPFAFGVNAEVRLTAAPARLEAVDRSMEEMLDTVPSMVSDNEPAVKAFRVARVGAGPPRRNAEIEDCG